MTIKNFCGESARSFQVLVSKDKAQSIQNASKTILYPSSVSGDTIALMERLLKRGFDCVAVTKSFGEVEYLSIDEMKIMNL